MPSTGARIDQRAARTLESRETARPSRRARGGCTGIGIGVEFRVLAGADHAADHALDLAAVDLLTPLRRSKPPTPGSSRRYRASLPRASSAGTRRHVAQQRGHVVALRYREYGRPWWRRTAPSRRASSADQLGQDIVLAIAETLQDGLGRHARVSSKASRPASSAPSTSTSTIWRA